MSFREINNGYNETPLKGPIMFKRYAIKTSLVKNPKPSKKDTEETTTPPVDYVQIVRENGKDAVVAIGALIGGYVVLDTLRTVTIEIVKAKL